MLFRSKNHSKPLVFTCSKCGKAPLSFHSGKYGEFFTCDYCGQKYQYHNGKPEIAHSSSGGNATDVICPICKKGHLLKYTQDKDVYYRCENKCTDPERPGGKVMYYRDYNGKPLIQTCPKCHSLLSAYFNPKGLYFKCYHCNEFLGEKNGTPVPRNNSSGSSGYKKGR